MNKHSEFKLSVSPEIKNLLQKQSVFRGGFLILVFGIFYLKVWGK